MSVPALMQYQNGLNQVSGDNLNTFIQSASNVANLRTLTGVTGQEVALQGYTSVLDGGQGFFYWNPTSTGPDDGGVTNVVPNGAVIGCWTRLGTLGAFLPISGGTITGNLTVDGTTTLVGNVTADGSVTAGSLTVTGATVLEGTSTAPTAKTQMPESGGGGDATQIANMFAAVNTSAGGFVNVIRNAGCNIASRGTTGTVTSTNVAYTLDGFQVGATGATVSWAQGGQVGASYNSIILTGATSMTDTFIRQPIASYLSAPLATVPVTFQVMIYNQTGGTLTPTITIEHATAQDNFTSTVIELNAAPLSAIASGVAAVVAYTFIPSGSAVNGIRVTWDFGSSLNSGAKSVSLAQFDARNSPFASSGINTNPPYPEVRPPEVEAVTNSYYYQKLGGETSTDILGSGFAASGTVATINIPVFPTKMRAIPTLSFGSAVNFTVNSPTVTVAASAISLTTAASYGGVQLAVTTSTLTSSQALYLRTNTTADALRFSAEL